MPTLYRDYRPQNFSELLGQNHIKTTVQNEIISGQPAQAYLFCGPRAVGKTTLARILAKAVNCEKRKSKEYEPCNACATCQSITAGRNMDIIEIDAASNTGVDNVRENIIAFSRLAPSTAKFKVFIIDEVHMLSVSAFNALLKIIEEPPAHVIFILATTEIQKVPGTIVSRCERFDFKRIGVSEIAGKLARIAAAEKVEITPDVLEAVARRSGGHLRDAESLLGQIFSLGGKKITSEQAELVMPRYNSYEAADLLDLLSRKDAAKAVALINSLADSGVNMKTFTGEIISLLRKVMLAKISPETATNLGLDLGENLEKKLSQISSNLSLPQLLEFTRLFLLASDNQFAAIPQLSLEMAIMESCFGPAPLAPINTASANVRPTMARTIPSAPAADKPVATPPTVAPAKPKATPVTKGIAVSGTPGFDLAPEEIMAHWPEVLVRLKKFNHSLSFVLQNCEPREIKNGVLSLAFRYKFHQDRINDPSTRSIVESVLAEVFGQALAFSCFLDENLEIIKQERSVEVENDIPSNAETKQVEPSSVSEVPEAPAQKGLLGDLLKTFGGEIIS